MQAMNLDNGSPITLKDPEILKCPWEAYDRLLEEAPVYYDKGAGFFVVTRYEDIRKLLKDSSTLATHVKTENSVEHAVAALREKIDPAREAKVQKLFLEKGWPRERPVGGYEGAQHKERRAIFEKFLRAGQIKNYEDMIRRTANELIDRFIDDGKCDLVTQFSEPYSLLVICNLVGAPEEAIEYVKAAVEAMLGNLSMTQSEEEELAGVEAEIRAQHYFKGLIDNYRAHPDGSILGEILNAKLPSGDEMTEPQVLMHLMLDLFFAGAETTAKAITSGLVMLDRHPDVRDKLQADPEKYLRNFCEEVLRIEPPFSGNLRVAVRDFELHGVQIPKASVVHLRIAAGNLDHRQFACPNELDLVRRNAAQHVSFGSGDHACVGAPLARRELYIAFETLLSRLKNIRVTAGQTIEYAPSMLFRGIPQLHVEFEAK